MIVESPKNGAIRRAAASSAPSVAAPTVKTRTSSRRVARPTAARWSIASVLGERREVGLARAADRAVPVVGDVLEARARRNPAVRIPLRGVVDEPARLADPLLRGGRRHVDQGYPRPMSVDR